MKYGFINSYMIKNLYPKRITALRVDINKALLNEEYF